MSTSNDIFKEVPGMGEISQLLYQRPCDALHRFPFRHDRPPAHGVLPADKVKPSSEGSSHPMTALLQGWGGEVSGRWQVKTYSEGPSYLQNSLGVGWDFVQHHHPGSFSPPPFIPSFPKGTIVKSIPSKVPPFWSPRVNFPTGTPGNNDSGF